MAKPAGAADLPTPPSPTHELRANTHRHLQTLAVENRLPWTAPEVVRERRTPAFVCWLPSNGSGSEDSVANNSNALRGAHVFPSQTPSANRSRQLSLCSFSRFVFSDEHERSKLGNGFNASPALDPLVAGLAAVADDKVSK